MLISATFGNENFQHSSAKYQLFACRSSRHNTINPAEKHMWIAAKDGDALIARFGSLNKVPAAPGYREEMGKWSTAQYEVPEGVVIKLFGQRKLPEMVSGRHTNAAMFLHVREEAALIRVTGSLTGDARANASSVVAFEGRADILTVDEARDLGLVVSPGHVVHHEQYNRNTLYTVLELGEQVSARAMPVVQEVENTQGERRRVVTPRRTRAIQV